MKARLIGRKLESGSSTLEILIAFSVLILTFTAVIAVAFGNQTSALYTELNHQALYKAEKELENARALSRQDFNSVLPIAPTADDIYLKTLLVDDLTQCLKRATSTITWQTDAGRPQKIELATMLADIAGAIALGGDCLADPAGGDWINPLTFVSRDIEPPGNPASDLDVAGKIIYLTGGLTGPTSRPDFFILDARSLVLGNPSSIPIVSSISTGDGLMAVDFASTSPTKAYAFVANDEDATSNQLQVIDVGSISNPILVSQATLPGVSGSCPYTCPGGKSIFYYDHTVYIGTHRLVGASKHELHVYDVSDPTAPVWQWSYKLDHNVNKIIVREQNIGGVTKRFTYLATSADNGEVIILDITDPSNIKEYRFNANGNEDGRTIFLIGNKLYLGRDRTPSGRSDFFVLDVTNPAAITILGEKRLGLNSGSYVAGIRVSGRFGFLAINDPNDGFRVYDVSNPANMPRISTYNFSQKTTGIDFDGEYVYTSNESNDALRIIYDAP